MSSPTKGDVMLKATGIIRRVDELGRIVVPKELRSTLRIKDGTSLEIYTNDNGELVLKKYSPMEEMADFGEALCDALRRVYDVLAVIVDSDGIIAKSGRLSDKIGKGLTPLLAEVLGSRRQSVFEDGTPYLECGEKPGQIVVTPIICKGDLYGGMIIAAKEVTPEIIKAADLAATVLKNHIN